MSIAIPSMDDLVRDPWDYETITTADGVNITACFYSLPNYRRHYWRGSVIIVPAIGVPQDYYRAFAVWLAEQGYLAVTFDYRGMGRSLHGSLRKVEADVFTWAELDTAAVIDAISERAPRIPLTWIGHSLGGQILPFVPNRHKVSKIITVGTGSGYWKENAPPLKRRVWLFWYGFAPVLTPLFGYFPGKMLGLVGNLPRGVIEQWRRWSLHPDYLMGVEDKSVKAKFDAVKTPLLSLSFSDDEFMSAENTASLHGFYSNTKRTMRRINPKDVGVKRIGHFGFFRKEMEEPLWERYVLTELA